MIRLEDHRRESSGVFGETFVEIHRWLDAFVGATEIGLRHRRKRHHVAGVEDVRRLYTEFRSRSDR